MDVSTIESQQRNASRASAKALVGLVKQVDEAGNTLNSWRIYDPRCSIGAGANNHVTVRDGDLAETHAAVVFGKIRTLIRAVDGRVQVNGRTIQEGLFDESTQIQCGSCRLVVVPAKFVNAIVPNQHWVTAGSVSDQASRLKTGPILNTERSVAAVRVEEVVRSNAQHNASSTVEKAKTSIPASLRVEDLTEALAPIQKAVERTNEGISDLRDRVEGLETKHDQLVSKPATSEIPVVVDLVEKRINNLSEQYQSAFQTLSTSLDQRLDHLGQLIERIEERTHFANTEHALASSSMSNASEPTENQHRQVEPIPSGSPYQGVVNASVPVEPLPFNRPVLLSRESLYVSEANPRNFAPNNLQSQAMEPAAIGYSTLPENQPSDSVAGSEYTNPAASDPFDQSPANAMPYSDASSPYLPVWQSEFGEEQSPISLSESQNLPLPDQDYSLSSPFDGLAASADADPFAMPEPKAELPSWFTDSDEQASSGASAEVEQISSEPYQVFRDQHEAELQRHADENHAPQLYGTSLEPTPTELSEGIDEPKAPPPSEWASARLNPIYAEDTSGWLQEVEAEGDRERVRSGETAEPSSANDAWYQPTSTLSSASESEYPSGVGRVEEESFVDDQLENSSHDVSEQESADSNSYSYFDSKLYETDELEGKDAYSSKIPTEFESHVGIDEAQTSIDTSNEHEVHHAEVNEETSESSEEGADESIEDYMARLLARVKGGPGSEPTPAKPVVRKPEPAKQVSRPMSPSPEAVLSFDSESPVERQPLEALVAKEKPSESTPTIRPNRSQGERFEDRAALRELANQTARSAIQKSSKKKLEVGVWGKLSISLMGFVGGVILLFLNGLDANITMIGMICSFVICLLWGYEASVQAKLLFRSNEKSAK